MDEDDQEETEDVRAEAAQRLDVAVANVKKGDITEIKSLMKPPKGVPEVF